MEKGPGSSYELLQRYMPSGRSMLSKSKVLIPSGWIESVSLVGNLVLLVEEGTIDRAT